MDFFKIDKVIEEFRQELAELRLAVAEINSKITVIYNSVSEKDDMK